ncbi:MAG: preprotein translocase subunit SecG [Bacteroidales bacterium]|jgi:preprotein translocase subunit SecG|nr:preprotein translocase subunit SecG [Bacteroidales bacterium]MBO7378721.1 preprotein translocase subunit SecG [Bacteroidales bacterium]MBP5213986.1 preprotein translocase subunit SecG [Bacteroidales bacterium]MBP5764357.1 preprotein translocase subunit SecG [Bacteroidales bacterium]
MSAILVPIIVILAFLLIAIVLIQKSKGGGLAAGFQSSNQIMGAPKTADFLEKATWSIMAIIAVLSILCTVTTHKVSGEQGSVLSTDGIERTMSTPENVETEAAPVDAAATTETNN